jgi:hypothetical protein
MYLAIRARVVLSSGETAPPTYTVKPEWGQERMSPIRSRLRRSPLRRNRRPSISKSSRSAP